MLSGRDAPHEARHAAAGRTATWFADAGHCDLDLLLSETVTNAVKHGAASPTGSILVEGEMIGRSLGIEVTNDGTPFDHVPGLPPASDPGGRGLMLVDALAHRWGTRHQEGSTTVWFELDVDP